MSEDIDWKERAQFWRTCAEGNLDMAADAREANQMFRYALESIAKNTCCAPCQEAARVAQEALKQYVK